MTIGDLKQLAEDLSGNPSLLALVKRLVESEPDETDMIAARDLFGLSENSEGRKPVGYADRKNLASRHLRVRAHDRGLSDEPLSRARQKKVFPSFFERLAKSVDLLAAQKQTAGNEVGISDEITIDLRRNGTISELRHRVEFRSVAGTETVTTSMYPVDLTQLLDSNVRPGINVSEVKLTPLGPDSVVIHATLDRPVGAGEIGVFGYEVSLQEGAYKLYDWSVENASNRDYLDMTVRVPAEALIEFRLVELDCHPRAQIPIELCPNVVHVSKSGVVHHRFGPYTAGRMRGLVWSLQTDSK